MITIRVINFRRVFKILLAIALIAIVWFLFLVFSGALILPQFFHLGSLTIHYYGIIMALAALCGFYLAMRRAPKFNIDKSYAEDLLFWIIIGGFIGARLYHVLSSITYYWIHPIDIFKVWNGGLSIYGAVLGGILVLLLFRELPTTHYPLPTLFDWLAPSLLLGQIIGRFGNLFNYEAFGYPTSLPWKMFVPENFRPSLYISSNFFHPWFLYEAIGNLIILFLLLKVIEPNNKTRPGTVGFFYLLLYNALRFGLEFLRIDSTFIHGIRLNSVSSLLLAVLAASWLFYNFRHAQAP